MCPGGDQCLRAAPGPQRAPRRERGTSRLSTCDPAEQGGEARSPLTIPGPQATTAVTTPGVECGRCTTALRWRSSRAHARMPKRPRQLSRAPADAVKYRQGHLHRLRRKEGSGRAARGASVSASLWRRPHPDARSSAWGGAQLPGRCQLAGGLWCLRSPRANLPRVMLVTTPPSCPLTLHQSGPLPPAICCLLNH